MAKIFFNLEDDIVRDSLDSLSESRKNPVVVGGMCIQLYARNLEGYLRNTADIDLITDKRISYSDFSRDAYPKISNTLKQRGYKTQPKNGRINNSVIVIRNPNKEYENKFLIHFTKPGSEVMDLLEDYIRDEISRSKIIEYSPERKSVRVLSLEESLPLKIRRSIRLGNDRESIVGPIYSSLVKKAIKGDWSSLALQPMKEWINPLNRMQKESQESRNRNVEQTYKLSKDIYDLCLSAKIIEEGIVDFDKDRYQENNVRILGEMGAKLK